MVAFEFLHEISLPQIYIFCERKQISNERINLAKLSEEDITKWEADNIIPFSGTSACLSVTHIIAAVSRNVKEKLICRKTFPS